MLDLNHYLVNQKYTNYNLVQRSSFPYYNQPHALAGILIDIHPDKLNTVRTVYTLSAWLGEIGGFSSSVLAIISLILPLIQYSSLQKSLISKLFYQKKLDKDDKQP